MMAIISKDGDHRSFKMGRIKFVSASFAAILLALSCQQTMAQGELQIEPHPFDSLMSPYPLGPLQKFGDRAPGSAAEVTRFAQAPRPPQAHVARNKQAQRRPTPVSDSRQAALRSPAPQHERQRGPAALGPLLSLAPRTGERLPMRPFCFPSSTLHIQQNQADNCYVGATAVRGRFEELLGE
jgi:hypothetical protein